MRKLLVLIFSLSLFSVTQQAAAEDKNKTVDVVLIGGGIMSATLGTYLHELEPTRTIDMYERMNGVAEESSNGWNNAGTGHSAFSEMNYAGKSRWHHRHQQGGEGQRVFRNLPSVLVLSGEERCPERSEILH